MTGFGFHTLDEVLKKIEETKKQVEKDYGVTIDTEINTKEDAPLETSPDAPVVKAAPFAVIGDFNGDRVPDAAVRGHTSAEDMQICILSAPSGNFKVAVLDRGPRTYPRKQRYELGNRIIEGKEMKIVEFGSYVFLELNEPGLIDSPIGGQKPLRLTTHSFTTVYFMKAAILQYYRDGKFHDYYTGD